MNDVSRRPDHGHGPLGQAADALLAGLDLADKRPVLGLLYNVLTDPPGAPACAVAPTDPELWDCAPTPWHALDLLAQLTHVGPTPIVDVDERPGSRLDGIALACRVWAVTTETTAGQAMWDNMREGHYRRGDIAASPFKRGLDIVTAFDRQGRSAALMRPETGGPIEQMFAGLGVQAGASLSAFGATPDGLTALLTALHERQRRGGPREGAVVVVMS